MFNDIKLNWPSHIDTRLPLDLPFTLAMRITPIGLALTSEPDDRNANFVSISWVLTNERIVLPCIVTEQHCLYISYQSVSGSVFGKDRDGDAIWKGWAVHNRENNGHQQKKEKATSCRA